MNVTGPHGNVLPGCGSAEQTTVLVAVFWRTCINGRLFESNGASTQVLSSLREAVYFSVAEVRTSDGKKGARACRRFTSVSR